MANQCLICLKQLKSKAALKSHTGTDNPTLRKPHVCRKCDRPFCSQKAMESHRDSPAHINFSCDVCSKSFGSKQAIGAYQKSLGYKSTVQRPEKESARQALSSATTSARNASLYPTEESVIQVLTLIAGFLDLDSNPYIWEILLLHLILHRWQQHYRSRLLE